MNNKKPDHRKDALAKKPQCSAINPNPSFDVAASLIYLSLTNHSTESNSSQSSDTSSSDSSFSSGGGDYGGAGASGDF